MTPRVDVSFLDTTNQSRHLIVTMHFEDIDAARSMFRTLTPVPGFSAFVASIQIAKSKFEHCQIDSDVLEQLTDKSLSSLLWAARSKQPHVIACNAPVKYS